MLLQFVGICQQNTDGEFIFKTHLFLEKPNVVGIKGFDIKGTDLLSFFNRNIGLTFDTLQSFGFAGDYYFLSLSPKEGIKYNEAIMKSDSSFLLFVESACTNYVLAINRHNGRSYRLHGFRGNDFFSLFADINKEFESLNEQKISVKKFLKYYSVGSVDFNCLYSALKSGKYDKVKYPCLKSCEGQLAVIH